MHGDGQHLGTVGTTENSLLVLNNRHVIAVQRAGGGRPTAAVAAHPLMTNLRLDRDFRVVHDAHDTHVRRRQ